MNFGDIGIIEGIGCGTLDMTAKSKYIKDAYDLGLGIK